MRPYFTLSGGSEAGRILGCAIAALLCACASEPTELTWEISHCGFTGSANYVQLNGQEVAIKGCRAQWTLASESVAIQLLTSTNSHVDPGPQGLTINIGAREGSIARDFDLTGKSADYVVTAMADSEVALTKAGGFGSATGHAESGYLRADAGVATKWQALTGFFSGKGVTLSSGDVLDMLISLEAQTDEGEKIQDEDIDQYRKTLGPAASNRSAGGSGSCTDDGKSCESDGQVVSFKQQCTGGAQRPCYCAAAFTMKCFLQKGCYKEAGAATATTKADLEAAKSKANSDACDLGGCCF